MLDKLLPELSADAGDHLEDLQRLMKHVETWHNAVGLGVSKCSKTLCPAGIFTPIPIPNQLTQLSMLKSKSSFLDQDFPVNEPRNLRS